MSLREISSIVPEGRRVRVVSGHGRRAPQIVPKDEAPPVDHAAELRVQLAKMAEQVATMAVAVDSLSARLGDEIASRSCAPDKESIAELARAVDRMAQIIAAPVEPVYDASGKLIGARRAPMP